MAVGYRKVRRKNPQNRQAAGLYYPNIVTQRNSVGIDYLADIMQEFSSLSVGDIRSTILNLPKALHIALGSGVSVKIEDFGVFHLTAISEGKEKEEDCTAKCIKGVKIRFRASGITKPAQSTRGATGLKFYNVDAKDKKEETIDLPVAGDNDDDDGGGIDPDA